MFMPIYGFVWPANSMSLRIFCHLKFYYNNQFNSWLITLNYRHQLDMNADYIKKPWLIVKEV